MNDFATGQNTVEGSGLAQSLGGVPKGEGGLTQFIRDQINAERAKNNEAPLTAAETAAQMKEKADAIQAELAGTPGEEQQGIAFADLTPEQQEKYLGITTEELQVAQTEAADAIYESLDGPATEIVTAEDSCNFLCETILHPFGGVDGARRILTNLANSNSGGGDWSFPVDTIDSLDDIPTTGGSLNSREFDAYNRNGNGHTGLDVPAPKGSPIKAIQGGKVIEVWGTELNGYGRTIVIQAEDGSTWSYSHNDSNNVKEGDIVEAGAVIGTVGDSGNAKGGFTHTHIQFYPAAETAGGQTGWDKAIALGIRKGDLLDTMKEGRTDVVGDPRERMAELAEGSEDTVVLTDSQKDMADQALDLFNTWFPPETVTVDAGADEAVTEEPKTIGEQVGDVVSNVVDTVIGIFTPTPGDDDPTAPDSLVEDDSDDNDDRDDRPVIPEPEIELTIDLTAKATEPFQSNANEFRFKGDLTRVYSRDQTYEELQKYFSVSIENRLNLDYSCDGSVDVQKTFNIPYRTFAWSNNTSTVLLSEYMEVSNEGSHCFWFEIDTQNVLKEINESNNSSNKYNFTI